MEYNNSYTIKGCSIFLLFSILLSIVGFVLRAHIRVYFIIDIANYIRYWTGIELLMYYGIDVLLVGNVS